MQQVPGESLQISDICTDLKRFAQSFERIENKHFGTIASVQRTVFPGVNAYLFKKELGDIQKNMKLMLKKQMSRALETSKAMLEQESYKVQMSPGRRCDNVGE